MYYGLDEHGNPTQAYFRQPHEIAAQYMGIKCTYEFLCGLWDDEARAEAAVVAVHNDLITKDSAYIQKPFGGAVPHREKVSEILDDLDSPENIRGKGSKERKRLVARPGAPPDRYGQAVGALGDVALGDEDRVLDGQGTQLGDD